MSFLYTKKTKEVKDVEKMNQPHKGMKLKKLSDNDLVIEIENIRKKYITGNIVNEILKGVSLKVYEGEFVVILGPSGSGKTTLMNIISGLDRPTDGEINVLGNNLINMDDDELTVFRRFNIGYIFQQYGLIPNLNAHDNIYVGEYLNRKNKKVLKKEYEGDILEINEIEQNILTKLNALNSEDDFEDFKLDLKEVNLSLGKWFDNFKFNVNDDNLLKSWKDSATITIKNEFEDWRKQEEYRFNKETQKINSNNIDNISKSLGIDKIYKKYPNEMSGGQQQRISIARSFAKNPSIIFADEPTGAVDLKMSDIILENFKKINREYKTTIVIVTHNPDIAKLATKVVYFADGKIEKIIEQTPQEI